MDHADHVGLLRTGVPPIVGGERPVWADVGAGSGAFTLALADLLGPGSRIIAIDRDAAALRSNAEAVAMRFAGVRLDPLQADFGQPLELPILDGIVMANSLHFVRRERQAEVVARLVDHLAPRGRFLLVEYDADRGNPWVPYPLSIRSWMDLSEGAGLTRAREIGRVPSRFLGAIYSAASDRA